MKVILNLSVHDLVDFLLRKGDIDNRIFNKATMQEGTKIHAFYQAKAGPNYLSEYPLELSCEFLDYSFKIQGRADGIIINGDYPIIDEIKSCVGSLEDFFEKNKEWHLGQAKLYALMYLREQNLDKCGVSLTYISQVDKQILRKNYTFNLRELKNFLYDLLEAYTNFYDVIKLHEIERNETCKELKFPYLKVRKNQKEMIEAVVDNIKNQSKMMIEAPTGIGKTVSSLFPHIKCFGRGIEKIFFLTAKGSGANIVKSTLESIYFKGGKVKSTFINAKEKMCLNNEQECNPDKCPFTKDYYTKLTSVITAILKEKNSYYDDDYFINKAKMYNMCPFELSLDVSSFTDIVICDYNYIFDPFVFLERYLLGEPNKYSLLIDEGHNLISRSRSMYSGLISLKTLNIAKKSAKGPKFKDIRKYLKKLQNIFADDLELMDEQKVVEIEAFDAELLKNLSSFIQLYQAALRDSQISIPLELKDFYLDALRFAKLYEYDKDGFCYYLKLEGENLTYNIYCISPTKYISGVINLFHNTLLFSATLTPFEYYKNIIFGENNDVTFKSFSSPFDDNHLNFMVNNQISMKYQDRTSSIDSVCSNLKAFCESKLGNYLIFVPSFEYINLLKKYLVVYDADIYYQKEKMTMSERNEFINVFQKKPTRTSICVAVIGGVFSESIDLIGDLLIGVAILGVGFPQLSFENNKIKEFYDKTLNEGFNYAYVYPGMNNVTQAIGRLIRSENDIGSVLLIDKRYRESRYLSLFKAEWKNYKRVYSPSSIIYHIKNFYENNSK